MTKSFFSQFLIIFLFIYTREYCMSYLHLDYEIIEENLLRIGRCPIGGIRRPHARSDFVSSALHLISRSIIGDPTSRTFSSPRDRALEGAFRRTHLILRPAAMLRGKIAFRSMHGCRKVV